MITLKDHLGDLICHNEILLQLVSCFNIPLGLQDKTIEEVCVEHQIDIPTFVTIINHSLSHNSTLLKSDEEVSIPTIILFLKNSHSYFIDTIIPRIRKQLEIAIQQFQDQDTKDITLRFFNEFAAEVSNHMGYEDAQIFEYVDQLLKGEKSEDFNIITYAKQHNKDDDKNIEDRLSDLKHIIIKYCPAITDYYTINSILRQLFSLENQLKVHRSIEDYLFIPAIYQLEQTL